MIKSIARWSIKNFVNLLKKTTNVDTKINTPTGLTNKRLNAIFGTRGVTDMLLYRSFEMKSDKDNIGFYTMADGRRGFILQISPPPYLGDRTEKIFRNLIASLAKEGHVINISTYASKNVNYEINRWSALHAASPKVDNLPMLKEWSKSRAEAYKKWTKNSMMRFADIRLRNFITTISVLAPYGSTDEDIIDLYRKAMAGLGKFVPVCFFPEDLMRMTNEIFKPNKKDWEPEYDKDIDLNHQIGLNTKINVSPKGRKNGTFVIDDTMHVQTLTTARMPKYLTMFSYQQLFYDVFCDDYNIPLPSSYMVSMTISAKDIERTAEAKVDKAVSDQDWLRKIGIKDASKNPHFGDRYNECVETVSAVKERGERLYKTMFQIYVFEEDETKLDRQCKTLIERFKLSENGGWALEQERHPVVALNTFLYSLPLMHLNFMQDTHLKHRFFHRWTSNNATTAPIVGDAKGVGDFLNIFEGRTGQLQRIDFRAESNQNIIIIGPMGTGKSYLINEFLMSAISQGVRCRVFDLGSSSKAVCENIGGKHIEFDAEKNICMNFFTNIIEIDVDYLDEKNGGAMVRGKGIHPEEYSTIIPMIGLMCKQDLKSSFGEYADDNSLRQELSVYIQRAVETAHRRRGTSAGMREVVEVLKEMRNDLAKGLNPDNINSLISGLHNYGSPSGMYYKYFNGANNIDIADYDFAVFEFEKLRNMGDLLYVAQAGIMQKIAAELFYDRETPKLFSIDEVKVMALDNPIMISYLEDFSLRLRKYGVIFIQATQASSHYQNAHPKAREMYSLAAWKIFLQRDETAIEADIKSGALSLGAFEKRIMQSLRFNPPDFAEFYVMGVKNSMVCRLKVEPLSNLLYTTSPSDQYRINEASKATGFDRLGAIYYLSKIEDGYNLRDAFNAAQEYIDNTGIKEELTEGLQEQIVPQHQER